MIVFIIRLLCWKLQIDPWSKLKLDVSILFLLFNAYRPMRKLFYFVVIKWHLIVSTCRETSLYKMNLTHKNISLDEFKLVI